MKLLVVSATSFEIEGMVSALHFAEGKNVTANGEVHILVTGAGMTATAFAMGSVLAGHTFDLAINLGIAGSFDRNLKLGENVLVTTDTFAELGAEDGKGFIPIDELGFGKSVYSPARSLFPILDSLNAVSAITVNTVHGDVSSIDRTRSRLHPQTESMEGAAFFYSCEKAELPAVQVRAISNYVEPRNKANWDIVSAIKNLNDFAVDLVRAVSA